MYSWNGLRAVLWICGKRSRNSQLVLWCILLPRVVTWRWIRFFKELDWWFLRIHFLHMKWIWLNYLFTFRLKPNRKLRKRYWNLITFSKKICCCLVGESQSFTVWKWNFRDGLSRSKLMKLFNAKSSELLMFCFLTLLVVLPNNRISPWLNLCYAIR